MKKAILVFIIYLFAISLFSQQDISLLNKPDRIAQFPEEHGVLENYIKERLPSLKEDCFILGEAFVSFKVDTLGLISDIKVIRGFYNNFESEISKVLINMPKWIPAEIKGVKVESILYLSLKYKNINK